jgi:amino acid transporter
VLGVVAIIVTGLSVAGPAAATPAATTGGTSSFGLMMVFVLLTYGGWNEAAYASAELRDVHRNMVRALVSSILIITGIYVLVNYAYLHALGFGGVAGAQQVAAEVMRQALGESGAKVISVLIAISALTSANASVFTGARTSYAFGCDFQSLGFLGRWSVRTATPVNALLVQGAVALGLVLFGTIRRQGFQNMVDYTAPVFWFFFLCTGIAFFVLRLREPGVERPFRVPLYPITPFLFCLSSTYLLYSSLDYNRKGSLVGVAVVAIGGLLSLFVMPLTSKNRP